MQFDYFYGDQSEQFTFFRIPKCLFTDEPFKKLSTDAKLLYGLMLDRMSLSRKNDWYDMENKVFTIYPVAEIMRELNCSETKVTKLLAELDTKKGIGLLERKRRGQGKPDIIYVKNFLIDEEKTALRKEKSRTAKNRVLEPKKTSRINNVLNNTDKNKDRWIEKRASVLSKIKYNIEYKDLHQMDARYENELIDDIVELMADILTAKSPEVMIASEYRPAVEIKERFLKIRREHIEYVYDQIKSTDSTIRNIRAYILAALYNSTSTKNSFYRQKYNQQLRDEERLE